MVSLVEALPSEIIVDITSRLPVKSIFNCTLVCKFWKTLIPNPLLAKHNHTYLLLFTEELPRFGIYNTCVGNDRIIAMKPSLPGYHIRYHPDPDPRLHKSEKITIFGSCNGLVCFSQKFEGITLNIYLYNPGLGESVTVPKPVLTYPWYSWVERYAFGFCPITNHYKVFRSVDNIRHGDENAEVEIYTLGSWRWRHIGRVSKEIWTRSSPICAGGSLHWIWNKKDEEKFTSIFVFNLATEEFGWSPPPPIGRGKYMYKLGYMDHCLVATVGPNNLFLDTEIWMRKDSTWSKNWVFWDTHMDRLLVPLAISADGIILMTYPYGHSLLYSLDPKEKRGTPRAIADVPRRVPYVATLASPRTWSGVVPYDATLVSPRDVMKDVRRIRTRYATNISISIVIGTIIVSSLHIRSIFKKM